MIVYSVNCYNDSREIIDQVGIFYENQEEAQAEAYKRNERDKEYGYRWRTESHSVLEKAKENKRKIGIRQTVTQKGIVWSVFQGRKQNQLTLIYEGAKEYADAIFLAYLNTGEYERVD